MNGLTSWMEKYILPVAGRIGAQKHLVALRDAFIGTMPSMVGSVAVMINAIIRDLPQQFISTYADSLGSRQRFFCCIECDHRHQWVRLEWYLSNRRTDLCLSWGYNLARAYGVNDLAGGIVGLATLIQGIAFGPSLSGD